MMQGGKDAKWYAIYTKYKCEKLVVERLLRKDINAYVPLLQKTKRYGKRIRQNAVPLINCYAFAKVTKSEFVKILETENVISFLKIGKEICSIPEEEINILKKVVGEIKEDIELSTEEIKVGETVEIISGNLTGMKGSFLGKSGKKNFQIELHHIGYNLLISVDPTILRRISNFTKIGA